MFFFSPKVKFATGISLVRYAYQNESSPEYVKAQDFLTANDNFVRDQIQSSLGSSDEYWQEMAIVWAQLDGLVAGNAATCGGSKCLDLNVFLFLQAEQELLGGSKMKGGVCDLYWGKFSIGHVHFWMFIHDIMRHLDTLRIFALSHTNMHACMHAYVRTYVHTHIHTRIHTYRHTYNHATIYM